MLNNLLMKLKDLIRIRSVLSCYPRIDLQLLNKSKLEILKPKQILGLNKNHLAREKLILN